MNESKTILIVEDSRVQGMALKYQLEKHGFQVHWAMDGNEGVIQAKIHLPSFIIMDIELPGINGLEACQQIKTNLTTKHIPIIMLTARDDLETLDQVRNLGAVDFIPKDELANAFLLETLDNLESESGETYEC